MTRASLTTRASPALNKCGKSRTHRSSGGTSFAGRTIIRASLLGSAGRKAIASDGKSKSNRSTRMHLTKLRKGSQGTRNSFALAESRGDERFQSIERLLGVSTGRGDAQRCSLCCSKRQDRHDGISADGLFVLRYGDYGLVSFATLHKFCRGSRMQPFLVDDHNVAGESALGGA